MSVVGQSAPSDLALVPVVDEVVDPVVRRSGVDRIFRSVATSSAVITFILMGLIGGFLLVKGYDALKVAGWGFLTDSEWAPDQGGKFGIAAILPFTVQIAVVALFIAVPVALTTALFITEYAPRKMRRLLTAMIDLLAAVPSLIYGLWGLFFLQPRLITLSKWMADHLSWIPFFHVDDQYGTSLGIFPSSTFISGVIVSLMVIPICTAVMREVFSQAPPGEREGAMALGGTRWGVVRDVVLPFGRSGVVGGAMLGLGRALGETIAVYLLLNINFRYTFKILESEGGNVASLIATKFGEATPDEIKALVAAGFVLFMLTLTVNMIASTIVAKSTKGSAA